MSITVCLIKTPASPDHLYIELARTIEASIRMGSYSLGEKLPSLRNLHRQHGVSIGTAMQVYAHLEDKGLVESKPQSGYFVRRHTKALFPLPSVAPFQLVEQEAKIDHLLRQMRFESLDRSFITFASAVPPTSQLPLKTIKRAIQQVSRDLNGSYLVYDEAGGYPPLRKAIAQRAWTWQGVLQEEELIITNGALEAVGFCLRAVTRPGDTVVVSTPCYYGILQCLESLNLKVIELPNHPLEGIRISELEQVMHRFSVKACVLVSNFNNPDGVSLSSEQKEQLARLAQKNQLPILEDDIYGELYFGQPRPLTIKSFDTEGWVMLCSSFSKTLAPGFRIGWCAAGRFARQVERLKFMTNVATPLLTQMALTELLQSGSYDRHLRRLRKQLQTNAALLTQYVKECFPKGTKLSSPMGGYVLWVELPVSVDSLALQKRALEQKIGILPGALFSNRGDFSNFIRLSFGEVWNLQREEALIRLTQLLGNCTNREGNIL